ncbi:MAG TPA: hypothetical protein VJ553_02075 [Candidatus Paceibacterota bacterium]|nr:hypothetical protein [Candidatus Paceibacterota bacterium]
MPIDTLISLRGVARSWLATRDRIVKARTRADESALFAADSGTHTEFLRQLVQHQQQLAGVMLGVSLAPREIEALAELFSSWNSEVQSARHSVGNRG